MRDFFKNWDFFRWLRLAAGIGMLSYGAVIIDWPFIILGTMVGWMAVANTGCSPFSNSCEIEPKVKKEDERVLEDNK